MSELTRIVASFFYGGKRHDAIPVINPGGWFGKAHVLSIDGGYDVDFFVVEADHLGDAEDILVEDDEHGHRVRIEDHEKGDYGYEASPGDTIGGIDIEEKCWVDLNGKVITDPEVGKYLSEPHVTGHGVEYDTDHLGYVDARHIRYFGIYEGEELPAAGMTPKEFSDTQTIQWEVVVGNVGTVLTTCMEHKAREWYADYVRISQEDEGHRTHGEDVTLFKDGYEVEHHQGHLQEVLED